MSNSSKKERRTPHGKCDSKEKSLKMRREIGILTGSIQIDPSQKVKAIASLIMNRHESKQNTNVTKVIDLNDTSKKLQR